MKRSFGILLSVIGVYLGGCELRLPKGGIANGPRMKRDMAREVYKVCPDVVDQGAETVEKLALEMGGRDASIFGGIELRICLYGGFG